MLVTFSIFPIGKGESIRKYVAEAVDEVDKSRLDYRLTAMGTVVEGDWDDVMRLMKKVHDRVLKMSDRIYMTLAIDDRKDKRRRMEAKVKAVEAVLGKSLKK